MCARLYGPGTVIAIDTSNERLELAKEQGLADVILNPFEQDVEQEIRNLTLGAARMPYWRWREAEIPSRWHGRLPGPMQWSAVVACDEEPQMLPLPDMYGKNLVSRPAEWTLPAVRKS